MKWHLKYSPKIYSTQNNTNAKCAVRSTSPSPTSWGDCATFNVYPVRVGVPPPPLSLGGAICSSVIFTFLADYLFLLKDLATLSSFKAIISITGIVTSHH